jgi:hypothetical protein
MGGGLGYSVSPQSSSSQYIAPVTTGYASNAAQAFYFGGNPNVAALSGNKWLIVGAVVAVLGYAYFRFAK